MHEGNRLATLTTEALAMSLEFVTNVRRGTYGVCLLSPRA